MHKDFQGILIPEEIWELQDLSIQDRVILSGIKYLSSLEADGNCCESNESISKFFSLSTRVIQRSLSKLKKLGYIEQISFDGRTRSLKYKEVR